MKKLVQCAGLCALMFGLAISCAPDDVLPDTLATPTGLTVETLTDTAAGLSWTAVNGAEKYYVVLNDGDVFETAEAAYEATGLTPETEYVWKVQAVKGTSGSKWSEPSNFKTTEEVIAVPTGLQATDITHISAKLTWSDASAERYEVVIGDKSAIEVTEPGYEVINLTPETAYTWKVRAGKYGRWSEWSEPGQFTSGIVPAPTDLTVAAGHANASLSWRHSGADSHELVFDNGKAITVMANNYMVTGLTPETTHTWKVRSCRAGYWSDWADGGQFSTAATPAGTEFPYLFDKYYYGSRYFGAGTSNFFLKFVNYDEKGADKSGWYLAVDIIATAVDESPDKEYLDIPAGTYTFNISGKTNTVYTGKNDTKLAMTDADGMFVEPMPAITGGTMTVAGNSRNYTFTFKINLQDGTTFECYYNGAVLLRNPQYVPSGPAHIGILNDIVNFKYNSNPSNMGVDVWSVAALQGPSLYMEDTMIYGSGWMCRLQLQVPMGSSSTDIPDHVYNINRTGNAWTVMGGNGEKGMAVYYLDQGNIMEVRWLSSGTATVTSIDGTYKIDVAAVDTNGNTVTYSVQGIPPR